MESIVDFIPKLQSTTVAFGRFDGVHLGHREVIRKLATYDNPVLLSFADNSNKIVYTEEEKKYVLKTLGIENIISVNSEVYETMELSDFVRELLIGRLGARTIVIGENYDKLDELTRVCIETGIELEIVPTVKIDGIEVTTALVRNYFQKSNMNECLRILGGSYVMIGPIVHGKGEGRKHAMPTANLRFSENKLWPIHGVYGTNVCIDGNMWKGMTNIGLRPSDDSFPIPTCETYILDFNGDLYGKTLILEAFTYLRPVMHFKNLDEVRAQIDKDISICRHI